MRLAVSIGAMVGGFVASAIVLALVELYVTGHGGPSINRPWIQWPSLGVSLGRADFVALLVGAGAGVLTWLATGRAPPPERGPERQSSRRQGRTR